jgi:hypothetical protein
VPLAKGTVTFNKDIAPIMFENCTSCHRPGEVAPFSLLTYADAKKRAKQIAIVTEKRIMPPWKAESEHDEFINARRLTARQIGLVKQWAADGAPEGNAKDLPPAPKYTAGWQLGEPDAVLQADEQYSLAADGADVYRCFVIPTDYAEDRYIAAIEVRPENRAVVHHVIAFLDTTGRARKLDAAAPGPGYTSFGGVGFAPSGTLGGWAPGNLPQRTPPGTGTLLPKGADIVLQVHYHPSGKPEADRTKIGLYFSKGPIDKRVRVFGIMNPALRIPAGEKNYEVRASHTLSKDATILAVLPHMHLLGKDMTVSAKLPDGSEKRLVRVVDWDFDWQTTYAFREPVKLPAGSSIDVVSHYDNSSDNPRNPNDPPRVVTWGEQTTDEMCFAFIPYIEDAEHLTQGIVGEGSPADFGGSQQRFFEFILKRFDKNGDGKLDDEERAAVGEAMGGAAARE